METYWESILTKLQVPADGDPILECDIDGLENVVQRADELLSLANRKLHVFPFKDVKPCWFRLYTDASIAKAVRVILACSSSTPSSTNADMRCQGRTWLEEVISILDKALIVAGGMGREGLVHEILTKLEAFVPDEGERPAPPAQKKRKLGKANAGGQNGSGDILPSEDHSLPQLKFPVTYLEKPTLTVFEKHMKTVKTPVILGRVLEHWPALDAWRHKTYWLDSTLGGRRLVPIEVGRSYTDDHWGQTIVSFKLFLDTYILHDPSSRPRESSHNADDEPEILDHETGYLAQHDLLKQIPSLRSDIATPDFCFLDAPPPEPGTPVALNRDKMCSGQKVSHPGMIPQADDQRDDGRFEDVDVQTNIWFGPPWTISPLHHDPYHNILCQVVGKKYIRLYAPEYSAQLYPRRKDEPAPHLSHVPGDASESEPQSPSETVTQSDDGADQRTIDMSNTSSIDIAAMELSPEEDWDETYPGFSKLPYVECVLQAGQALYIPVGWWHYVRSCSVGISVSFWW